MWTSLNRLSTPRRDGNSATRSAVGPRKHQLAVVPDDDASVSDVVDDEAYKRPRSVHVELLSDELKETVDGVCL
jgi:hypothetical protein